MDETVSASEANRAFSRLIRGIQQGHSYTVTAHGRPVARIVAPNTESEQDRRVRAAALGALLNRVRGQPTVEIGRWKRDELYER